jgi:AcrR family transcriptional regulator
MADKLNMKQQIIDAVVDATISSTLRNVQITKIVKTLNINHNTFYYHFGSKYDVALWVFRHDLAQELRSNIPAQELIGSPLENEAKNAPLPYYMHREIGARLLDHGVFFKSLVRCVMQKPLFYGKLFNDKEPEFKIRIYDLYRSAIEDDIRFILDGRYMPEETFDFMVSMQLDDIYRIPAYHLAHSFDSKHLQDDTLNPFWNLSYELLTGGLQKHPINKIRRD